MKDRPADLGFYSSSTLEKENASPQNAYAVRLEDALAQLKAYRAALRDRRLYCDDSIRLEEYVSPDYLYRLGIRLSGVRIQNSGDEDLRHALEAARTYCPGLFSESCETWHGREQISKTVKRKGRFFVPKALAQALGKSRDVHPEALKKLGINIESEVDSQAIFSRRDSSRTRVSTVFGFPPIAHATPAPPTTAVSTPSTQKGFAGPRIRNALTPPPPPHGFERAKVTRPITEEEIATIRKKSEE